MIDSCPYNKPEIEDLASVEAFLYFVWEREVMRIAKENGYQNITEDEILSKYRFCNIRRKDDRVSKWFIDNVYSRLDNNDCAYLTAAVCRFINWPPTIKHMLDKKALPCLYKDLSLTEIYNAVEDYGKDHDKIWTGAYVVRGSVKKGIKKSSWIIYDVIGNMALKHEDIVNVIKQNKVQTFVEYVSTMYGFGTFMAGQIAADLTYMKWLKNAVDLYTWAPIGPGSTAGLNIMLGLPENNKFTQEEFNDLLMSVNAKIKDHLDIHDLTLHDVQNCFCEYGKYAKAVAGISHPRNVYRPETAF